MFEPSVPTQVTEASGFGTSTDLLLGRPTLSSQCEKTATEEDALRPHHLATYAVELLQRVNAKC